MSKPFGNPIWDNIKKLEIKADGTFTAPVKANGEDGIVIGDPPLGVPPKPAPRKGMIVRVLERFRG